MTVIANGSNYNTNMVYGVYGVTKAHSGGISILFPERILNKTAKISSQTALYYVDFNGNDNMVKISDITVRSDSAGVTINIPSDQMFIFSGTLVVQFT